MFLFLNLVSVDSGTVEGPPKMYMNNIREFLARTSYSIKIYNDHKKNNFGQNNILK